ncbi:MAG: hypothetical protein HGB12_07930 [Bacteroidetes bacterium]|nr:hypothetical protein [Bacteroidota bacterium]
MNISHALPFNFSQLVNVIKGLPSKEKLVIFQILKDDTENIKKKLKLSDKLKGTISKDRAIQLSNDIENMREKWNERTF